jgi:hypothetical protein
MEFKVDNPGPTEHIKAAKKINGDVLHRLSNMAAIGAKIVLVRVFTVFSNGIMCILVLDVW